MVQAPWQPKECGVVAVHMEREAPRPRAALAAVHCSRSMAFAYCHLPQAPPPPPPLQLLQLPADVGDAQARYRAGYIGATCHSGKNDMR